MNRYYLTDGGHCLISGATGAKSEYGGKTTTANWWWRTSIAKGWHDVGCFVNPKGHSSISQQISHDEFGATSPRTVSTLEGMNRSYRSGNRLFDVQVRDEQSVDAVVKLLRNSPGRKIVVFDEAQMYRDSDMLNWVLSQGGNLDSGSFRALVLTQRPWNLPEELRGNLPVKIWTGPVTPEGKKFFKVESMKSEIEKVEADMAPYHWAVTDAGEYQHTNPPVPEEYA